MKWIELIHLRSATGNRKILESKLHGLIDEVNREEKGQVIVAYNRILIDSDFSIHILHDSKKPETNGSRLGLRLIDALKEFGLVNHSIWMEMNSK